MPDQPAAIRIPGHPDTRIAVLFTSLHGAAALYKTRGDADGSRIIRTCTDSLMPVIRAYKGVVVKTMGDAIMAYFLSPREALFAAIALQKKMRTAAQQQNGGPPPLRLCVAVHYGFGLIEEHDIFGDVVNIAGKLIAHCAAGEILVTDAVYRATRDCPDIFFSRPLLGEIPASLGIAAVYTAAGDPAERPDGRTAAVSALPDILPLFRTDAVRARSPVCFYCGTAAHAAAACPSRHLRTAGVYLEKLCALSLRGIAELFQEHYTAAVSPLAPDDRRHELIMGGGTDPAALCFFSFYEASRLFQLRSLRYLGADEHHARDGQSREAIGALRMAEDCLRVARHDEARHWLARAMQEQPDDVRLPVLQGLLQVQCGDLREALACFTRAYDAASDPAQRRWIACLTARAHEVHGNAAQALRVCGDAGCAADGRGDILYYYATLLVLTGAEREGIAVLERLGAQSPRYLVLPALGLPNLPASPALRDFLNGVLTRMREHAAACLAEMRAIVAEHAPLFDADDESFQSAAALCDKAAALLREESVAGLMDIPAHRENAVLQLRRALGLRSREIRRGIAAFDRDREAYGRRIAGFPYPRLLGARFFDLREQADLLLAEARATAGAAPPPPLKAVRQLIERLRSMSARLAAAQARLDFLQQTCFVLGCALRLVGVFCGCTAAGALLCVGVLSLYRAYETSAAALTAAAVADFARFGIVAGAVIGALIAGFWFAKNVGTMYKKTNRTD